MVYLAYHISVDYRNVFVYQKEMNSLRIKIGDTVRVYDEHFEWFSEGKIFDMDETSISVDFLDWKQQYDVTDIEQRLSYYSMVLVAKPDAGITLKDFR